MPTYFIHIYILTDIDKIITFSFTLKILIQNPYKMGCGIFLILNIFVKLLWKIINKTDYGFFILSNTLQDWY